MGLKLQVLFFFVIGGNCSSTVCQSEFIFVELQIFSKGKTVSNLSIDIFQYSGQLGIHIVKHKFDEFYWTNNLINLWYILYLIFISKYDVLHVYYYNWQYIFQVIQNMIIGTLYLQTSILKQESLRLPTKE